MNTSTTTTVSVDTTTTFPLDLLLPYFKNSQLVINIYSYGFSVTFLLGFLGNIASLLTFSRPILRKVSTGCLFLVLAVSDTLFLIASIFDFVEFGLQVSLYRHVDYSALCRFRWFVISVSQLCSAWILILISIDRWIRTRFAFKAGTLCTPKKALLGVVAIMIIIIGLNSHYLLPAFGMLLPGYSVLACSSDLNNMSYTTFYFLAWNIIQIFTTCLIPVSSMIGILIDIFISVRIRKQALNRNADGSVKRDGNLQRQMFFLMLASICVFLITTLPLAIYRIMSPRQAVNLEVIQGTVSNLTILTWLQSLNYAINFYSHCLTSKLFRKQFIEQIQYISSGGKKRRVMPIELAQTGHRTLTRVG